MSFSSQVKGELLRIHPEKHCCMLSEISALTQACASLRLSGGGRVKVVYEVESAPLAKRIFLLMKKRLEITPVLSFARYKRLGGQRACVLTVAETDTLVFTCRNQEFNHPIIYSIKEDIRLACLEPERTRRRWS